MFSLYSGRGVFFLILVTSLIVTSCKKSGSPTGPGGSTGTVAGTVKDVDGIPISGVSVIIKGKSPVVTDANGGFTINNVTTPYDITLIMSTYDAALVYKGLTRSNPTVYYPFSTTDAKTATISGTVPAASGKTTEVFFVSGQYSWSGYAYSGGSYSISAEWRGSASSLTGTLYVLRWTTNTSTNLPSQYDGLGSANLTISDGGTFSGHNFASTDLTDPAEQSISGSIVRPTTSYSLTEKDLYMNFGNAYVFLASERGASMTDNFSYTVPVISGATFEVDAYASLSSTPSNRYCSYWKTGIAGGATGVTVPLAAAPQLNLPANNGTGVDTTTQFLWAQGGGSGINLFEALPSTSGGGPEYFVYTSDNTANLPNLAPWGLGLPSNTLYSWQVTRDYPIASVDSIASDKFIALESGNAGDLGSGSSEIFTFTTKVVGKTASITNNQHGVSSYQSRKTGNPSVNRKAGNYFGKNRSGSNSQLK